MKTIQDFLQTVKTQLKQVTNTPVTDKAEESWGARKVVDAIVARKLEKSVNEARTLLKDTANELIKKGGEFVEWGQNLLESALNSSETSKPKINTFYVPKINTFYVEPIKPQNVAPPLDEFTLRVQKYIERRAKTGRNSTIRKIKNSFSPKTPSTREVCDALTKLGYKLKPTTSGLVASKED